MNGVEEDVKRQYVEHILNNANCLRVLREKVRNFTVEGVQDDENDYRNDDVEQDGDSGVLLRLVNLTLSQEVTCESRGSVASAERNHED